MKKRNLQRLVLAVGLVALLAAGCAKKPAPAPVAVEETPVVTEAPSQEVSGIAEGAISEAPVTEAVPQPVALPGLQRIHFDFDQYVLTDEARATLAANADYLKANSSVRVKIEGHCDERGSDEYNLALGERRALAAQNYLVSLGIASVRLELISYGEELPLDPRSSEDAWAKNRRAEFKAVR